VEFQGTSVASSKGMPIFREGDADLAGMGVGVALITRYMAYDLRFPCAKAAGARRDGQGPAEGDGNCFPRRGVSYSEPCPSELLDAGSADAPVARARLARA
jgi:hypothetical protein